MYDKPNRVKHTFGLFDFGAGTDTAFYFIGPKSKAGLLWDYGVEGCVEVMNGGTTTPKVSVGSATTAGLYGAAFDINALAANSAKSVRSTYEEIADNVSFILYMTKATRVLPKDTLARVNCIAAAGSPTGQAVPYCIVDWDD